MPIKSYIAVPSKGNKENLQKKLDELPMVDTLPAENKDVIIVVTDTGTQEEDKKLLEQLNTIDCLAHLTMVAGYETDNNPDH